jgi:hypothetical protein
LPAQPLELLLLTLLLLLLVGATLANAIGLRVTRPRRVAFCLLILFLLMLFGVMAMSRVRQFEPTTGAGWIGPKVFAGPAVQPRDGNQPGADACRILLIARSKGLT